MVEGIRALPERLRLSAMEQQRKTFILLGLGAASANGPARRDLNQFELHRRVWRSSSNEEMSPQ